MVRRSLLAAGFLVSLFAEPDSAKAAPPAAPGPPQEAPVALDDLVSTLIAADRVDEADALLAALKKERPEDPQITFLQGLVALAKGDHRAAERAFRAILVDHPEAVRVRLELARALFLAGDLRNAERQFRFARSGTGSGAVKANIDDFLARIREARDFSWQASFAIAPDSNINVGSSSREVTIYGLPFDLSDDARKRSGVGLDVGLAGEWAPRLSRRVRLKMGAAIQRREYAGRSFDETSAALYAGPRVTFAKGEASLSATAYQRYFAGKVYSRSAGLRASTTIQLADRSVGTFELAGVHTTFPRLPEMNGWLLAASAGVFRVLDPASALSLRLGLVRQNARVGGYASWSGSAGVGYYRDLPWGFSVQVQPSISLTRYDTALPAFGMTRRDWTLGAQVSLLNRRLEMWNLVPKVTYGYTRQFSNIGLYSYDRSRIEVGFTAEF